ncbi:MAG: tRNA (guanine37-N1)-methyltransferase [Granulosicoccus sp.]|jgi:tRNA (guanine37-N1)-methyltransferase
MRVAVITLFPEMFAALTDYGITGRAVKNELLSIKAINPRDFTHDRHQTVDDRPYGGGPGMVMMIEPLTAAVDAAKAWLDDNGKPCRVIYLSPQGTVLSQSGVADLAQGVVSHNLVLIAGRYEGIDERFLQTEVDEEWSIGDYVLSGGELPAMVLLDAVIRLLPNALGHKDSAAEDSFSDGLLDYPHYTRPETYEGQTVPSVLLSGNHAVIKQWRLEQSLERTRQRRPDLLKKGSE